MAGRSKDDRSAIAKSAEYISFRSAVSLNRQSIRYIRRDYTWKYYDQGPKTVRSPFVFLPPVSGTADVWFRQLLPLSAQGYRCIALEYPCLDNVQEFCEVLTQLLDTLDLKRVHLVGASLGAFLAQVYAEHTANHKRVASLVLVNGFTDTTVFRDVPSPIMLKCLPGFALRRMILENLPKGRVEKEIADSIDFLVERLDMLTRSELLSRLILNVRPAYVQPHVVAEQNMKITIIDVNDECVLSNGVKNETYKYYPEARFASLKDGGNFPYLARSDEVNVFLRIHANVFANTDAAICEDQIGTLSPTVDSIPTETPDEASGSLVDPSTSPTPQATPASPTPQATPASPPSALATPKPKQEIGESPGIAPPKPASASYSANAEDGLTSAIGDDEL